MTYRKLEYYRRDYSVKSLQNDVVKSFGRVIKRAHKVCPELVVLTRRDSDCINYYFTMFYSGLIARVDLNESTPVIRLINVNNEEAITVRERYYGNNNIVNRLVNNLEEDLKEYVIAVNKLSRSEKNELFSIQ